MPKSSSNISKIAFIGQKGFPSGFPGTSGVELYVEKKIYKLTGQKKQIICYTRQWTMTPKHKFSNIIVHALPTLNTKHLDALTYSFLATIHAILIERINEVWYQGIGPGSLGVITKLFGISTTITIHTLDWKRKKWGIVARLVLQICERLSVANADTIYVVSKHIQQYIKLVYRKDTILDQLVLLPRPKPNLLLTKTLLREHETKPFNYILFMGRFVPEKRIEWAIQAFKELRLPKIRFLIAGGGSHTEEYEWRIKYLAASDPRIQFLGYVFGKEKYALLAYAKLLVLPSSVEGFPVVITEALQYNTPCLVPDFLKSEYPTRTSISYFVYQSYDDFYAKFKLLALSKNS